MTKWWAEDEAHPDPATMNPGSVVFTRKHGMIGDHPIALGRSPAEQIHVVMTFTGQALRARTGTALLTASAMS